MRRLRHFLQYFNKITLNFAAYFLLPFFEFFFSGIFFKVNAYRSLKMYFIIFKAEIHKRKPSFFFSL